MSATYLSFALAVLLLIASPGPIVAMVIADARRSWPAWTIAGGVVSAQVLLVCALVAIYTTLHINAAVLNWGQILGGVYLAWLGGNALINSTGESVQTGGTGYGFWKTMGVGLSNPKDILFFLAFLPGFISPNEPFTVQAAALILIWAAIDISILIAYSLLSRRLDRYRQVRRLLDCAPGIVLLALGLLSFSLGVYRVFQ
jgi:threonine/homoserine/homoserine lactone efflux protein